MSFCMADHKQQGNSEQSSSSSFLDQNQMAEKLMKMRAYQEALKGKAAQLEQKEKLLKDREITLLKYRKTILEALRSLLLEDPKIAENKSLMQKYDELLDSIELDVKDDEDRLMG